MVKLPDNIACKETANREKPQYSVKTCQLLTRYLPAIITLSLPG
jgi:hypothetical protein